LQKNRSLIINLNLINDAKEKFFWRLFYWPVLPRPPELAKMFDPLVKQGFEAKFGKAIDVKWEKIRDLYIGKIYFELPVEWIAIIMIGESYWAPGGTLPRIK
jgi:hypothetical protein